LASLLRDVSDSILTCTVDTGLLSLIAKSNIEHLTNLLNIDHSYLEFARTFKSLYLYYLEKNLPYLICEACTKTVSALLIKHAAEREIPAVVLGYSPYQFRSLPHKFSSDSQESLKLFKEPFEGFGRIWDPAQHEFYPEVLLPFHEKGNYPEGSSKYASIVEDRVKSMNLIKRTHVGETNCLLSPLIKYLTMKHFGYNPFIGSYLSYCIRNRRSYRRVCYNYIFDDFLVRSGIFRYLLKRKRINYVLSYLGIDVD